MVCCAVKLLLLILNVMMMVLHLMKLLLAHDMDGWLEAVTQTVCWDSGWFASLCNWVNRIDYWWPNQSPFRLLPIPVHGMAMTDDDHHEAADHDDDEVECFSCISTLPIMEKRFCPTLVPHWNVVNLKVEEASIHLQVVYSFFLLFFFVGLLQSSVLNLIKAKFGCPVAGKVVASRAGRPTDWA